MALATSASEVLGTPGVEQIKGKMIAAHRAWLSERLAPGNPASADLKPFWATVPEETRQVLGKGILAGTFYDFRHLVHLDEAIIRMFNGDRAVVLQELGEFSATHNIPRNAIVGTIHQFFDFSAKLHDQFQTFGASEYQKRTDRSGAMVYTGYRACHSPTFCASATGFFRGAIHLFGHKNAVVRETSCTCLGADACIFEMEWG